MFQDIPRNSTMASIAKAMWQLQRLSVHEYVQYLRALRLQPQSSSNLEKFN